MLFNPESREDRGHVFRGFTISLALVLLAGCGQLLKPKVETELLELEQGSYKVDPRHTTVLFKVMHMGLAKYVGRFNRFDAELDFDPADPATAKLTALVDISSLDINDPDFAETLTGSSWFDAAAYPQAQFVTRSATRIEGGLRFHGDLTLRGVTAPLNLDVHFNGGAFNMLTGKYTLGFAATGELQRSTFGMDRFVPAISDTVELEVHAEFQRR